MASESDRLLNAAFSSLDDKDKYETVLTGLCAKLIEDPSNTKEGLGDPMKLVDEMTSQGISVGPRGMIGLIDATAQTSDARIMANVLSLSIRNGAIQRYGSLQSTIRLLPQRTQANGGFFGGLNGGGNQQQQDLQRLDSLPPVPVDDRATEVSQAAIFSAVVAGCVAINVFSGLFGLEDLTPLTNLILGVTITTVVIDNFFDVLVFTGSTVTKLNEDKLPEAASKISAPKKEDMPLGIGTGSLTGNVVRGLSRLLSDNTERDCECEAAAIFAAYSLGLPCFAFKPNALEGATLVLESMGVQDNTSNGEEEYTYSQSMDSLASDAGVLKVLIWLMAPVAMELSRHPQLLSSDAEVGRGFLQRLGDKARVLDYLDALEGALPDGEEETDDYLRWAIAEADAILRDNADVVGTLGEALVGGAATVGDCVAVLEDW